MSRKFHLSSSERKRVDLGDGDFAMILLHWRMKEREASNRYVASRSELFIQKQRDPKTGKVTESVGGYDTSLTQRAAIWVGTTSFGGPGFCVVDHDETGAPAHIENGANAPVAAGYAVAEPAPALSVVPDAPAASTAAPAPAPGTLADQPAAPEPAPRSRCEPMPVTDELIEGLEPKVADLLYRAIISENPESPSEESSDPK